LIDFSLLKVKEKKKKETNFEEDAEINLYFDDNTCSHVLLASHNTCEDLIRKGIEISNKNSTIDNFDIYLRIEEEGAEDIEEKKLDKYDLPIRVLNDHQIRIEKRQRKNKKKGKMPILKLIMK